jgi:D-alanyl-D-alanine carboxypeptidase/D-alanyl-D-alanine-endopeptidase (penicillin-binding protein 4)
LSSFPHFKQVALGALAGIGTLALLIVGFTVSGVATINTNPAPEQSQAEASASPTTSVTPNATRTCSVATQAADARLGSFSGIVINADTDEVLFDRNGNTPAATASTLKLLTAVAALNVLGPNYRVETKVYSDSADPGNIFLVGAGDPTLSRLAAGKQSVYKDAPKLADLAIGVKAALGTTPITKITLVSTAFAGPSWESSWERSEQTQGYMSEVTALQVDGDRANPTAETSARSTAPVQNAGKWFKAALGAAASTATISTGSLPNGATQITSVLSQPISQWIKHMLLVSDNTQAEFLARLVSLKQGFDGSFSSLNQAFKRALTGTSLDSSSLIIKDGSGLSNFNAVPPVYLAKLSKLILNGGGNYQVVLQGLPIAGESGSLASRFKGDNLDASGHIIAKTGWIKKGYTLAGIINAGDGTHLVFAVYALGNVKDDAKQAIDDLVTAIYRCGNTLSND